MLTTFIKNRLKEPSTWRGLVLLATILGVHLNPDQQAAIITLGVALVGAIGVFAPDSPAALPAPTPDAVPEGAQGTTLADDPMKNVGK